ncbi:MAG: ATP-dependent Clp protease ATP-binding subunit [Kyrpidia tusciae]|nr:AAA family ATPase [Kyrpidia tusciae]MBE3552211.1 ATP-dependent Clp protease ATP-binding subunit [Kyrpidia tusciae]
MPFVNDMLQSFAQQRTSEESGNRTAQELSSSTKVVTRFTYDVDKVMQHLQSRIVGQREALDAIEQMLRLVRADIADPTRPLYIALFLGPTGVGKTEIVRLLAEALYGNREAFCRVDMNTLSQEHYAASLTGAPPGYVGSKEGATILDKEKIEGSFRSPGIVLFDEVEKASGAVLQTLLNVFDNGIMTVASGQMTINFRNALIFMTSNIGARQIQEYAKRRGRSKLRRLLGLARSPDPGTMKEMIQQELENKFSPEFLNRIDDIITFNWIDETMLQEIISLGIGQLNKRLQRHKCEIRLDPSMAAHLAQVGFDKQYGVRSLKRAIRRYVEVPLAGYLLSRNWSPDIPHETIVAHWRDGRTWFNRESMCDHAD